MGRINNSSKQERKIAEKSVHHREFGKSPRNQNSKKNRSAECDMCVCDAPTTSQVGQIGWVLRECGMMTSQRGGRMQFPPSQLPLALVELITSPSPRLPRRRLT